MKRHLKVASSTPQIELIQALVFVLLVPDVFTNHRFVASDGGDEIPSGPEVLPNEIALPLAVYPCQMNRALPFHKSDHLRYSVLRWDREHHVHMIQHQMPFLDPAFLALGQSTEYFSQMPA